MRSWRAPRRRAPVLKSPGWPSAIAMVDHRQLNGGATQLRPRPTECDGYHKMSDLGAASEPVHSGGESVAPLCPHRSDWMIRAGFGDLAHQHERERPRSPRIVAAGIRNNVGRMVFLMAFSSSAMTSADSLSLILRRLDEIERKGIA